MKKASLTVCILCITATTLLAQKIKYNNITSQGIIVTTGAGYTAQTINGISYKDWSAGIGVGYDNYKFSNIPVFLDVRKSFGTNKVKPFIYADAGISCPLYTSKMPRRKTNQGGGYIMHPTLYLEAGAGIAVPIGKINFLLSAGYCRKEFKYDSYFVFESDIRNTFNDPIAYPVYRTFDNILNGLAIRAAISF